MTILSLYQTVLTTALKHCDRVCVSVSYEDMYNTRLIIEHWKCHKEVRFCHDAIASCLPANCEIISLGLHEIIVDIQEDFGYAIGHNLEEAQEVVFTLAKEILSVYRTEGHDIKVNTNMCPDLIGIEVQK